MPAHTLKVCEEHSDLRLDVFLTQILPGTPSRSSIKRLIDQGLVTVNGNEVKVRHKVCVDDEVVVEIPDQMKKEDLKAENIPLDIFYEDKDIAILNKPKDMTVHPVKAGDTGTLVNALIYHFKELSDVNMSLRPGIVHRLDRETSGMMVIAKNNIAHTKLAKQFKKHKVKKQYLALVEGQIEFDEGIIDAPLGKHGKYHDRKAIAHDELAKEARTLYKVVKRNKDSTLVALFPETGRTHQLRVHLAYLGHPILGDDKYGKKSKFPRLALHAQSIGFTHPSTKQFVEFSTPAPKEFLE